MEKTVHLHFGQSGGTCTFTPMSMLLDIKSAYTCTIYTCIWMWFGY